VRYDATPREVHYGVLSERNESARRAGERPADRLWRPGVRAISLARFAIFVTVAGWIAFTVTTLAKAFFGGELSIRYAIDAVLYIGVTTLLTASALAYLLARLGALYRARKHHRAGRVEIDRSFDGDAPSLTVLVPSYCEETDVIRQTLLTTALQEYPDLRIVLLVDDPPNPSDAQRLELLENARALPARLTERLRVPRERFTAAYEAFLAGGSERDVDAHALRELAREYDAARLHVLRLADEDRSWAHASLFVGRQVYDALADDYRRIAEALNQAARENAYVSPMRVAHLYRRLAWTFQARFECFERKTYVSLSHEANKAMNLNSYLGLMGGRYLQHADSRGRSLVPTHGPGCDLDVPDSDYVLTLDADSVLLPEYCLRLVHLLEQPEFERVAVAQTPYSAFPNADSRIERIAGATTDVQHLVHQGLTHYGATFWVGANAIIRKRALDEIVEVDRERGYPIRRYIKDRTVIEDTESSVDLAARGWSLYNFPERLSYSATPPDFGSLCIQRQRWANGGLLIVDKLRGYGRLRRAQNRRAKPAELFLRLNYLASIAWASLGLIVLLAYPFDGQLLSPIILATALPYFVAMASDLRTCGYKRTDVIRIYGFNLLLLAVNVAGVVKSIGQAIGGEKIAFARTPKVRNRTAASPLFILVPYLLLAFSTFTTWRDVQHDRYVHAAYAGLNAAVCTYALVAFVGLGASVVDLWANLVQWLYRDRDDAPRDTRDDLDWVAVLYDGTPDVLLAEATAEPAPAPIRPVVSPEPAATTLDPHPLAADLAAHIEAAIRRAVVDPVPERA
jgi:cellulose synthase/poly-beta-1,6-N-acetylglucosamine synthase-like glycosyltransferase